MNQPDAHDHHQAAEIELPENVVEQIALISMENKKMEVSHKLFNSWLADLTLIGSEDVIREILKKNMQKFHSLFCKALGLLQACCRAKRIEEENKVEQETSNSTNTKGTPDPVSCVMKSGEKRTSRRTSTNIPGFPRPRV